VVYGATPAVVSIAPVRYSRWPQAHSTTTGHPALSPQPERRIGAASPRSTFAECSQYACTVVAVNDIVSLQLDGQSSWPLPIPSGLKF
jgi:hypothetical protein